MPTALEQAALLVADGATVAWDTLIQAAADDTEARRLRDLRALVEGLSAEAPAAGASPFRTTAPGEAGRPVASTTWGHLRLLEVIGRGAHGTVHRAFDTRLEREVALKLLDPDAPRLALDEARRLARVSHPAMVAVFGADEHDGRIGLWMELLRGPSLDATLAARGPFSAREAIGIGLEVCGALAAIHAAGLVHRDLKAQNVVREPGGRIVVMDLSASIDVTPDDAHAASLAGTPLYMAPELLAGDRASVASDIYAFGVLLYRLVTGAFPVDARTIGGLRDAHSRGALRPLREVRADLPGGFVRVVDTCLRASPGDRHRSASALERALLEADPTGRHANTRTAWRTYIAVGGAMLLAAVAGAIAMRALAPGVSPAQRGPGATEVGLTPDQYAVFAAFEELAFVRLPTDPSGAATAVKSSVSLVRPVLPGHHGLFATLYTRLSEAERLARHPEEARLALQDAEAHAVSVLSEADPLTSLVALEAARNSATPGEAWQALRRALDARRRGFALPSAAHASAAWHDREREPPSVASTSCASDSDDDGLIDCVEAAYGLDPDKADSDTDGVPDGDGDIDADGFDNHVALGLPASSFLVTAAYGAHAPATLGWQSPPKFPFLGSAVTGSDGPAYRIEAAQSMAYLYQRLGADVARQAMRRGFSLLARLQPDSGLATLAVDLAPHGPRFDLLVERVDRETVDLRLASSIVPREGPTLRIASASSGPGPLLELRYRPSSGTATLIVDGRSRHDGYRGHRQFQGGSEGAVSFGVARRDAGEATQPVARFGLVWLQIR
jgi:serine/threonine-protein kinase